MEDWILPFLAIVFTIGVIKPHWGIAIFVSFLPLESLLPGTSTVLFSSPLAAIGAVASLGAAIRLLAVGDLQLQTIRTNPASIAALAFIVWIFVTHPAESLSGVSGRVWVLSFAQLWTIFVIAGAALNTKQKHTELMICFAAACVLSASVAIAAGGIDETRSVRSAGLVIGENSAGRYFAVGIVFLLFLGRQATWLPFQGLAMAGAGYLMMGILFTGSRTGLILGLAAILLVPSFGARRRATRWSLTIAAFVLAGALFLPAETIDSVAGWFSPDVNMQFEGVNDNIRRYLWQAALEMWLDHPIAGSGMDGFVRLAPDYVRVRLSNNAFAELSTHNMYMTLLSDTGLVGFALFMSMIAVSVRRAWRAYTFDSPYGPPAVWLVTLGILLAGAMLKNDLGEKLLWISLGVAGSLLPARAAMKMRHGVAPSAARLTASRARRPGASLPLKSGPSNSTP